jgi:hypothetical protein
MFGRENNIFNICFKVSYSLKENKVNKYAK